MTKIVGLTGGIGSGKTMIANYIKSLGIPVYIADDEANKILDTNQVIKEISITFGKDMIVSNRVNKVMLSKLVFENLANLQKLNAIIHPRVKKHFENWLKNHKSDSFVVKETAILFESGSYKNCDKIITVTSPIETRIQRVLVRDKSSRESILKRMENQWTDEQKIIKSDFVINNLSFDDTRRKVNEILKTFKNQ